MSRFSPDFYGNEGLERSFQRVADSGVPSAGSITDGVLLEGEAIGTSATTITTGLGRDWVGYVICGQDAASDIFADLTNRSSLVLTASVDVTCNIWVF